MPDLRSGADAVNAAERERLPRERAARAASACAAAGFDAVVLLKSANVRDATGAVASHRESSREWMLPTVAVLTPGREPIVFGAEQTAEGFHADDEGGARRLAGLVADVAPAARRIAIDRLSVPLLERFARSLPDASIVDADSALVPARMVKLPGEIALLREAQAMNERAVARVLERLRPGVREIDLTAAFHEGLAEEGVAATHVESVWCASPRRRSEAPWTLPGAFPYRELTSDRVLRHDDLVIMDTGILHEGYMSDFGRTWPADPDSRPGEAGRRLFEEWCAVRDRLLEACRPGRTALDLRRAALAGWKRTEPPWPVPLYVAHSIGLGGVEPPFVGTELGEAVEERWELRPGMVIVLEPYVWEEGTGGYRAEETVVITESGCERFSRFSYGPFDPEGA